MHGHIIFACCADVKEESDVDFRNPRRLRGTCFDTFHIGVFKIIPDACFSLLAGRNVVTIVGQSRSSW